MKLFDVYSLYDIEPVKGIGCHVYDADGNEYLDLYGGHAVISIGHAHPHSGKASGYDDYELFLCNSGAEANENAMKLASFQTGRPKILAFDKAFHGRTSGAVAATDNPKIQAPFNSTPNVEFSPLNDIEAVEKKLATGEFAAVIVEGIQGVAGIGMWMMIS